MFSLLFFFLLYFLCRSSSKCIKLTTQPRPPAASRARALFRLFLQSTFFISPSISKAKKKKRNKEKNIIFFFLFFSPCLDESVKSHTLQAITLVHSQIQYTPGGSLAHRPRVKRRRGSFNENTGIVNSPPPFLNILFYTFIFSLPFLLFFFPLPFFPLFFYRTRGY